MGFSERVTALRKQAGWSQEELAQRLDVSRQAVSKWESGQAMPDLDRVVRMSELFGVSTDSLLKDTPEPDRSVQEAVRAVTMEEAEAFLSLKETMADRIAWAVLACVLAPTMLLNAGCWPCCWRRVRWQCSCPAGLLPNATSIWKKNRFRPHAA